MCINEFGETLGQFILEIWCLFLDYCEIPLDKTKIDPNKLLEILYFINLFVKFTLEVSDKELSFLNIIIKKKMKKYRWRFILRFLLFLSNYPNHYKTNQGSFISEME